MNIESFEAIVGNGKRIGVAFVLMKGKKQRINVDTENHFKGASLHVEALEFEMEVWQKLI